LGSQHDIELSLPHTRATITFKCVGSWDLGQMPQIPIISWNVNQCCVQCCVVVSNWFLRTIVYVLNGVGEGGGRVWATTIVGNYQQNATDVLRLLVPNSQLLLKVIVSALLSWQSLVPIGVTKIPLCAVKFWEVFVMHAKNLSIFCRTREHFAYANMHEWFSARARQASVSLHEDIFTLNTFSMIKFCNILSQIKEPRSSWNYLFGIVTIWKWYRVYGLEIDCKGAVIMIIHITCTLFSRAPSVWEYTELASYQCPD
jgi:hypothetical protein